MNFGFTAENAMELVKLLSPILVIFATYLTSRVDMRTEYKIGLGFVASAILAALTAYGEGQLNTDGNFWNNLFYIFTAAQAVYATVFKFGGLEKLLYAQEALASKAAQEVREKVAEIPNTEAKAILDPSQPPVLDVSAKVVNTTGDVK